MTLCSLHAAVRRAVTDGSCQANRYKQTGILRDLFVVRSVKRGMQLEEVFEKIGLANLMLLEGSARWAAASESASTGKSTLLRVRCGRMAPTSPVDPGNRRGLVLSPYAEQGLCPEHVVDSGCLP